MFVYSFAGHIDASLHNFQFKKRCHPYQSNTPIMNYELNQVTKTPSVQCLSLQI